MSKPNRKLLNRLIGALAPLIATTQETTARRESAALLRQARALRAVPQLRPAPMSQAERELARTPPMAHTVIRTAYDMEPASRAIEDLQPSWDNWNSWTYGGVDTSFTATQFSKARNALKREVWNLFRRGMTAQQIARTLTYTLEFTDPK